MSYRYILNERAQEEYEISLKWYAERSIPAAENFVKAVDNAVELICDHPERWANTYKDYHELGLKKYPFTIIYAIEADKKLIIIFLFIITKETLKKNSENN